MTDTQHQIYVSYADADEDWVIAFVNDLKAYLRKQQGKIDDSFIWYKYLLSKWDKDVESKIHLAASKYVLVILTPNYEGLPLDFPEHTVIQLDISNKEEISETEYKRLLGKVAKDMKKADKPSETPPVTKPTPSCPPLYVVITVTDTEEKAFRNVMAEYKIPMHTLKMYAGQYYTPFCLTNSQNEKINCGLIRAPKKGGLTSQSLASVLLREFKSQLIIMTGVCGGIHERVELNDVIFADSVFTYNTQYLVKDHREGIRPQQYRVTPRLANLMAALKIQLSEILEIPKIHNEKGLASGDVLFADLESELRQRVIDYHVDILGFEMEGHGLFHETWNSAKDQDVAIIKAVSDFADKNMTRRKDARQLKAATLAAQVTFELLANY